MEQVDIYTIRYCPYCASAKAMLVRRGIKFTEIDIAANSERRDEMIQRAGGQSTVPQIFIGPTHIGGSKELKELERTGQLESLVESRCASI